VPRGTAKGREKLVKKHLPIRLEPTLINRLKRLSKSVNAPIDHTISIALDALERNLNIAEIASDAEANVPLTVGERLEFLENNLAALVDLMAASNDNIYRRFNEAGALEKERLGALYRLLEDRLRDHDAAEKERFRELILSEGRGL